jgi:predicted acetyltransferase
MIEFRSLKKEELEDWFLHCLFVFNKGEFSQSYLQYFKNHWYNDPWRDLDSILVAVDGKQIASTLRVFHREIYILGQTVSMGGIGEVSTKLEYRGRGYSARLLNDAVRLMEKKGINVSMLSTGIPDFYSKFGWESIAMNWKVSEVKDKKYLPSRIREIDFSHDIPKVERIYREYSSGKTGPMVRNEDFYWANWVRTEIPGARVIEGKNGEITAYICTGEEDGKLAVNEFACLPGHEDAFDTLVSHICSSPDMKNCEIVYPGIIKSGLTVKEVKASKHNMFRVVTPFIIDNTGIETFEQLKSILEEGEDAGEASRFTYWNTDGF